MYVDILVHHHTQLDADVGRQKGGHHIPRLIGMALLDGHHAVVAAGAAGGQADVVDVRADLVRLAVSQRRGRQIHHPVVFRHGHTGIGILENGVLPHGDGGDLHHRGFAYLAVRAGILTEGAVVLPQTGQGASLDNDLRGGGHLYVDGLALDHLHRLAPQAAGHAHLIGAQCRPAL